MSEKEAHVQTKPLNDFQKVGKTIAQPQTTLKMTKQSGSSEAEI